MITPGDIRSMREQILALDQIAAAANNRDAKVRAGYIKSLRAGLDVLASRTRELERAAWEDK